jgi:hypothetical protein
MARLECRDRILVLQCPIEIIPAVQQLLPCPRIDLKRCRSRAEGDRLRLKINYNSRRIRYLQKHQHRLRRRSIDDRWQQPVLDGVARKDITERRCDHTAEPEIPERIH